VFGETHFVGLASQAKSSDIVQATESKPVVDQKEKKLERLEKEDTLNGGKTLAGL
jgi:hypothetical protein